MSGPHPSPDVAEAVEGGTADALSTDDVPVAGAASARGVPPARWTPTAPRRITADTCEDIVPSGPEILRSADLASLSALAARLQAGAARLATTPGSQDTAAAVRALARAVRLYRARLARAREFERVPDPAGRRTLRPTVLALRAAAALRRDCARIVDLPALRHLDLAEPAPAVSGVSEVSGVSVVGVTTAGPSG